MITIPLTPANKPQPAVPYLDLTAYDIILCNSSAGKDSQTMLDVVCRMAKRQGVLDRVVVVHADLGAVEWVGVRELAEEQAAHYGVRFEVVVKQGHGDLLSYIERRGMWPSNKQRYCTSDYKRGPIRTVMTRLVREVREARGWKRNDPRKVTLLNVMGMRAAESPARAKKPIFELDETASNGLRSVYNWLPIHAWTTEQVWDNIHQSGVRYHEAYDLGMKRLSCIFCVFADRASLMIAGKHNRKLLERYAAAETRMGHDFRQDYSINSILNAVVAGEAAGEVRDDWNM